MSSDPIKDVSSLMTLEIVHALSEGTNAIRKTVSNELSLERKKTDLSVFEQLEWKLKNDELSYYDASHLLIILFREFEYFSTLIQNLIGFYSAGKPLELTRRSTDVRRLIEEVAALFKGPASEKRLRIELDINGDPIIKVDRPLMRRVLINLLDNAVKYSYASVDSERFIKINCHRHSNNNDWMISFESYGVGITPDEISTGSVFQYGTRGELSGDRGRRGTGVGLAETKRIVDAHNGKVGVTSLSTPSGAFVTTVRVILPYEGGRKRNGPGRSSVGRR